MHCHIRDHVIPTPERDAKTRGHDLHDVTRHPLEAMAGLVIGITVSDDGPPEADGAPVDHLRLIARQAPAAEGAALVRGFSLNRGTTAVSGLTVPGPPIVLRRGVTSRSSPAVRSARSISRCLNHVWPPSSLASSVST